MAAFQTHRGLWHCTPMRTTPDHAPIARITGCASDDSGNLQVFPMSGPQPSKPDAGQGRKTHVLRHLPEGRTATCKVQQDLRI